MAAWAGLAWRSGARAVTFLVCRKIEAGHGVGLLWLRGQNGALGWDRLYKKLKAAPRQLGRVGGSGLRALARDRCCCCRCCCCRNLVKPHHSTRTDTSPLDHNAKVRPTPRQLPPSLTPPDARPCYIPRRLGPHPRRPPRLPVDPRADVVPLPLPRGSPQQLALRPAEEGLRLQVLGLHG